MFALTIGDIGTGKSLAQAETILGLLERSVKIEKKYKIKRREVWINEKVNPKLYEKYKDRLFHWEDPLEMIYKDYPNCKEIRKNFDCVWDEISDFIPSDKWKETDTRIRKFFSRHRKRGIEIYANTQYAMMLDINARRMSTSVWETQKLCGSRDPSATMPPIRFIWGIVLKWKIDKMSIMKEDLDRIRITTIPQWTLITKKLCDVYDTTDEKYVEPTFKFVHREKVCEKCGLVKVVHT